MPSPCGPRVRPIATATSAKVTRVVTALPTVARNLMPLAGSSRPEWGGRWQSSRLATDPGNAVGSQLEARNRQHSNSSALKVCDETLAPPLECGRAIHESFIRRAEHKSDRREVEVTSPSLVSHEDSLAETGALKRSAQS